MTNTTQGVIAPVTPLLVEFILDETGSMYGVKPETIAGFNSFLNEQRGNPGECLITLTKFDSTGLRTPYVDLPLEFAPDLTGNTFLPGSMTNLYDAIGTRMSELRSRMAEFTERPHALVVVMTDGEDNDSRTFNETQAKAIIATAQADGITCVYMGAGSAAANIAKERLGFPAGNVREFANDEMRQSMQTFSNATTAYRETRAFAVGAETNYFGG